MADRPPYPGTPRWVKVSGIIVIILVLLVVVIMFTGVGGEHGPGRHMPSSDAGDTAPPSITETTPTGQGPSGQTPPSQQGQ